MASASMVFMSIPPRMHCRTLLRTAYALTTLLPAACRSGDGEVGPGPTPTAIRAEAGNQQTGIVGAALATALSVVVTDKDNKPIAGRRVDWNVASGSGSVSPTSSTTNSSGVATSLWTLGTTAGTARLTAQVTGVNPVTFTATVLPGAATMIVAMPDAAFLEVGDTLRVRGSVRDQHGNQLPNQTITFASIDSSIVAVSTVGLVSARAIGSTRIVVSSAGHIDSVPITVGPAGSSICGTIPPKGLSIGEVFIPPAGTSGASACIAGQNIANAEYALTLISTTTDFGVASPIDVVGIGTAAPVFAALAAPAGIESMIGEGTAPESGTIAPFDANAPFERQRRVIERRELTPLAADARAWYAERTASPLRAQMARVEVGDVVKLNVNATLACSAADTRKGRVAAVGNRVMIVTDNDNPTGGYTDAEYAEIAATFDTLVFPMDTAAFGAPSNISAYGRIILFYTRAVNALTPANAGYTIGGFFFSRDLYPKTPRNGLQGCAASNENEMFYLLVPDPNGTVNGNRRSKSEVTTLNLSTIAHELQHLINASRRLYVNPGAALNEVTWLDEGLSHVAEEMLYFRMGGFTSRQNLTFTDIGGTTARADQFRYYASQNFSRFYGFLIAPEVNSPYAPNDSLPTRGAIWNFLRFAAARQGESGEAAFFRALVNSRTTGLNNLQSVLSGPLFADYLRDWTVSVIADDYSATTTTALGGAYTNPAWNFRGIYPGLRFSGGLALGVYPIATRSLRSNAPQRITLAGGSSSYLRFSIPGSGRARITISNNGTIPPPTLRYALVRLR